MKLSYSDFVKTQTILSHDEAKEKFGIEDANDNNTYYVYDDCCYIEKTNDGNYYLIIYNQEWLSHNIEELIVILYNEFYLTEI